MVAVVEHPRQWPFCGYNEIQSPRQRYALIDYKRLMDLVHMRNFEQLQDSYEHWVDAVLRLENQDRESKWTESVAVGSKKFVETTKERLGIKAKGRRVLGGNGAYELREPAVSYMGDFEPENDSLSPENTYFWNGSFSQ